MIKRLMITLGALAMIFSPVFAQEKTKDTCFTPSDTHQLLVDSGTDHGVTVALAHEETREGVFVQYYTNGTERILVVVYDAQGCAVTAFEIPVADFTAITGIVLAEA